MPVLRSRKISSPPPPPPPPPPNPKPSPPQTLNLGFLQPSTPAKTLNPLPFLESPPTPNSPPISGRRSRRLASNANRPASPPPSVRKRSSNRGEVQFRLENDRDWVGVGGEIDSDVLDFDFDFDSARVSDSEEEGRREIGNEIGFLTLRSGTKVSKRRLEVDGGGGIDVKDEKGKGVLVDDEDDDALALRLSNWKSRRYTREEKGKGKIVDEDCGLSNDGFDMVKLELGLGYSSIVSDNFEEGVVMQEDSSSVVVEESVVLSGEKPKARSSLMEQFKDIAKRNAFKYAHFNAREEDEDHANAEAEPEVPLEETMSNVEDWPGPFSTAMKIIRDRENNLNGQVQSSTLGRGGFPLVSWTPKKERGPEWIKRTVPLLQDLCLSILAKNVDAITSLKYIPDVLRHRLGQLLCDSRKMNGHFLDLLLEGTPSEIRIADCSWLEEDKFEKSFEGCETSSLTVLQLDLCGHCMSDSSLPKALLPKGLPALTMISLKGACRISDVGLSKLVSSAPSLRSINLSQCSLLTDVGINNVANSLGSVLRELYLDDCESLDALRILPALKRLRGLEVLSLRGISSVSDKFMKELIISNGQSMKELVLANCQQLTDASLKVIAETCSQLCVLDLTYLSKVTDIGMALLANGCRRIQVLKLCRNALSDDAIAAFLEVSGASLKELSLNNVVKVGQNTTISLARRCKNLRSLDLSWCRHLTDEALGLIADSCLTLMVLKLFGCTQVTKTFLDGHSNPGLQIIGLKLTPILEHIRRPDFQQGPLHYSGVP